MKLFFIGWIVFQLIVIGIANVSIHNDIVNKVYKCPAKTQTISIVYGVIFPLALFTTEDREIIEYCYK